MVTERKKILFFSCEFNRLVASIVTLVKPVTA